MMLRTLSMMVLAAALLVGLGAAPHAHAAEQSKPVKAAAGPFSTQQQRAIEDIVKRYILENPEIIVEAVRSMRERQEREQQARQRSQLLSLKDRIVSDPLSPVGGNAKGDVTVVEFFDYRCGFCKRAFPAIKQLLGEDTGIRYVYKEFPILGDDSVFASRAAVAAWLTTPKRYNAFHDALMQTRGALPADKVMKIAADTGLDPKVLRKAMDDPRVDQALTANAELARAIGVNGTPAFIIGDELAPGAIDLATMKRMVAQARGS